MRRVETRFAELNPLWQALVPPQGNWCPSQVHHPCGSRRHRRLSAQGDTGLGAAGRLEGARRVKLDLHLRPLLSVLYLVLKGRILWLEGGREKGDFFPPLIPPLGFRSDPTLTPSCLCPSLAVLPVAPTEPRFLGEVLIKPR